MPDLDADTIAEFALKPAEAAGDGQSAKAHPIPDLILAAKFKAANAASSASTFAGLKKQRAIPPGPQE